MPRRIQCAYDDGSGVCGEDHHKILHWSRSNYCKALSVKVTIAKRRSRGRGRGGTASNKGESPRSMFALYSIPVSAQARGRRRDALVLKDLGATDNFITHDLARVKRLPSSLTSLTLRVLEDQKSNRHTINTA